MQVIFKKRHIYAITFYCNDTTFMMYPSKETNIFFNNFPVQEKKKFEWNIKMKTQQNRKHIPRFDAEEHETTVECR